jgi:F-box-like
MSSSRNDLLVYVADHISPRVTMDAIPDDILLDIFDLCLQGLEDYPDSRAKNWNRLAHVCQGWRYIVFASPHRLNLCLSCTEHTPVRETLDVWPPLPIEILSYRLDDNIFAALEHRDRVRKVSLLRIPRKHIVALMPEPFPALERLSLATDSVNDNNPPVLPSTFLGGSAPRLKTLFLRCISLPTLPQLLSSSNDLVDLSLQRIPHGGFISPEAMATCICALSRLMNLRISFSFDCLAFRPRIDRRTEGPSPLTRTVLASLTNFEFHGDSRYLEYIVAQIDAPVLKNVDILLFDLALSNLPILDIQNLAQFIDHSPTLMSYNRAEMVLGFGQLELRLLPTMKTSRDGFFSTIRCNDASLQLPCMAQICANFSFLLSGVKKLDIEGRRTCVQADIDDAKWLELFHLFSSVQTLQISRRMQPCIVSALEGLSGESATRVLPALGDLYLQEKYLPPGSGSEQKDIGRFIAARQCLNRPVTVHYLEELSRYK